MQPRNLAGRWWASALLVAPILAFFAPVLFGGRSLYLHDTATYFLPHKLLIGRMLRSGHLPQWNPFEYGGTPLIPDPNFNLFHPLSVLTALWPTPWGYGVFIAANAALALAGSWVLARELGLSRSGRVIAALCFVWSGTSVSLMEGGQSVAVASLPWLVAAFLAVGQRPGRGSWLGVAAASALMFVSGTPEVGACGFVLGAVLLAAAPRSPGRRAWPMAGTGLLAGLGLAFVQVWPTFLFFRESSRSGGWSFEAATDYSLHPLRLLNLAIPFFQGELSARGGPYWSALRGLQHPWVQEIYAGAVPLLLVVFGLRRQRERTWRWMALCTVVFTLLALGSYTPLYAALWRVFPPLRVIRFPEKLIVPLALTLAMFAGAGWDRLVETLQGSAPWRRVAVWRGAAVALALVAVAGWGFRAVSQDFLLPAFGQSAFDTFHDTLLTSLPIELSLLAAAVTILALAGAGRVQARSARAALLLLVALDLARPAFQLDYTVPAAELMATPEIVGRMEPSAAHGQWRFDSDHHTTTKEVDASSADDWPRPRKLLALRTEALSGALPALDGLLQARGYSGFTLQPMKTLFEDARGSEALNLLGVRYGVELGREGRSLYADLGFKPQSTVANGLIRVWANPHAGPRLQLVDGILADRRSGLIPDCAGRMAVWLSDADQRSLHAHQHYLPAGLGVSGNCERLGPTQVAGSVTLVTDEAETVQADVQAAAPALVLLNDAWDPGWSASVDDAPASSLAADGALRAVAVPAGHHRVAWRYWTPGLTAGALVSLLSLVACLVVALAGRRRRPAL